MSSPSLSMLDINALLSNFFKSNSSYLTDSIKSIFSNVPKESINVINEIGRRVDDRYHASTSYMIQRDNFECAAISLVCEFVVYDSQISNLAIFVNYSYFSPNKIEDRPLIPFSASTLASVLTERLNFTEGPNLRISTSVSSAGLKVSEFVYKDKLEETLNNLTSMLDFNLNMSQIISFISEKGATFKGSSKVAPNFVNLSELL